MGKTYVDRPLDTISTSSQLSNNYVVLILSQPNNKTTITVVGLKLSNRREPPQSQNSKLHDRVEIEQNSENKSH